MMHIKPKVYKFLLFYYDKDKLKGVSDSWVVARTQETAYKRMKPLIKSGGYEAVVVQISEQSWIKNFLILILPRYEVREEWLYKELDTVYFKDNDLHKTK